MDGKGERKSRDRFGKSQLCSSCRQTYHHQGNTLKRVWEGPSGRRSIDGCKTRFARAPVYGSLSSGVSQIIHHPKSKEGPPMPFRKSTPMDRTGIESMAEGWGKVVARRVHEAVGPDLDLDADDIEQAAMTAARAVARGTI